MPYGNELFGPTPKPPEFIKSSSVPLLCKLSPRQPGYVMTVWAEARLEMVTRKRRIEVSDDRELAGDDEEQDWKVMLDDSHRAKSAVIA